MKKYLKYTYAPIIVIAILTLMYSIVGIIPFGNVICTQGDNSIGGVSEGIYWLEILKGKANLFYSYDIGLGTNILSYMLFVGKFTPFNLFEIFFTTGNISGFWSLNLMLKAATMSLTAYIFFDKIFLKANNFYKTSFSVMYALSGYTFMNFGNTHFLEIAILFPLFILALKKMFDEDKCMCYIIILTTMLIFNFYISWMILFFIIFAGAVGIIFYVEKGKRKKASMNILCCTLFSLALSSITFLPAFLPIKFNSYRMSGAVTNTIENSGLFFKLACFLFSILPLLGFFKFLFKHKNEDKKIFWLYLVTILFVGVIPIIFERVNLMWHTGSYQSFPWRFGFIPLFVIFCGAMRYFTYYKEKQGSPKNKILFIKIIVIILLLFIIGIFSPKLINSIQNTTTSAFEVSSNTILYMAIISISIGIIENIILKMKNEEIKNILLSVAIGIQIIIFGISYFGVQESKYIQASINYKNEIKTNMQENYRLKTKEQTMFSNYGIILDVPTIDQLTNLVSNDTRTTLKNLGYYCSAGVTTGVGGTIFSDNILGVKYVISNEKLDNNIYTLKEEFEKNLYLYEFKDSLPIGIIYEDLGNIENLPNSENVFENQNYIYQKLFNKSSDNILEKCEQKNTNYENCKINEQENNKIKFEKINKDEIASIVYTIETKKDCITYMHINNTNKNEIKCIKVNGEVVEPKFISHNVDNFYEYGMTDANPIIELGKFDDKQEINVQIEFDNDDIELENLNFANLDLNKYNSIFNNKNENYLKINGNKINANININENQDKNLFIPISYNQGWEAKINGKSVPVNKVCGAFMSLELENGSNDIEMTYTPQYLNMGIKISLITLIILIGLYLLKKKTKIMENKYLLTISTGLSIIIYAFALYQVYIITIIKTITNDILK